MGDTLIRKGGKSLTKPSGQHRRERITPRGSERMQSSRVVAASAWLGLLILVFTTALTQVGYGDDLAYLERFGLRPEELQQTAGDFLLRSWHAVIHVLSALPKFQTIEFWSELLPALWWHAWWVLLSIPMMAAVCSWVWATSLWRLLWLCVSAPARWIDSRLQRWAWWRRPRSAVVRIASATPSWVQRHRWSLMAWFVFPVYPLVVIGAVLVLYVMLSSGVIAVGYLAALGASSGVARAGSEVLNPAKCAVPGHNDGARCVRVLLNGNEVARGRVIEHTASRIYLYRRCDKATLSIATNAKDIESTIDLGLTDRTGSCLVVSAPVTPARTSGR